MSRKIFMGVLLMTTLFICTNSFAVINNGIFTLRKDCTDIDSCYESWKAFWDDIDGTVTGNITLNMYAGIYIETTAPALFNSNLQTYTIAVQPATLNDRPFSSDGKTGVIFNVDYTDEFLNLDMYGTGSVVIDGIVVVVDGDSPAEIFEINDDTPEVTIKNCVIKGGGTKNDTEAILNNAARGVIKIYNNFIYDVYSGFVTMVALDSSSFVSANTIVDCVNGIDAGSGAGAYENNLVQGCGGDCFAYIDGADGNNNLCEDASCTDGEWRNGSRNQSKKTVTFTDELGNEFFPVDNEETEDGGANLTSNIPSNKDCFQRNRECSSPDNCGSAWDVGAYEYHVPRDYWVGDDGNDGNDGDNFIHRWDSFANFESRVMSPGDTVKLCPGDSWIDTANFKGVGAEDSHITIQIVSLTIPGTITGDEDDGVVISGNKIDVTENAFTTDGCDVYGVEIYNASKITITGIDSTDNGQSSIGAGFYLYRVEEVVLDDCIGNHNNSHGVYIRDLRGSSNEIKNSTFNYNGQIGTGNYGMGIRTSFYNYGEIYDALYDDNVDITNCSVNHSGYIGIGPGDIGVIDNCTVLHSGDGWSVQGVIAMKGTNTGLADGDNVTQDNSGATGTVHHVESEYHENDYISIYPDTGTFTDNVVDLIKKDGDAAKYWIPEAHSKIDCSPESDYSGGGIDVRYSTGVIIKYCETGHSHFVPGKLDAYGINADDESEGTLIYRNVSHHNDGPGIELHSSGETTPSEAYNNLCYANTQNEENLHIGGIYLNLGANGQAVLKNNISVLDQKYALVASLQTDESNLTMDYNCYWMEEGKDVINWIPNAAKYAADELDDFYTDTGLDEHSIGQDPKVQLTTSEETQIYRLRHDSPCIDAGTSDYSSPETDMEGNPHYDDPNTMNTGGGIYPYYDMGAYEYLDTVDSDGDGIADYIDNCPQTPNGPDKGTCTKGSNIFIGKICTVPGENASECGINGFCSMAQEDSFPPGGNSCGDACECIGDFDSDGDVDGTDSNKFKLDFFRRNCSETNPCIGDIDCSGGVDGTDAVNFKADFFRDYCPLCGGWPCVYE